LRWKIQLGVSLHELESLTKQFSHGNMEILSQRQPAYGLKGYRCLSLAISFRCLSQAGGQTKLHLARTS
jgi:hypothetical protein